MQRLSTLKFFMKQKNKTYLLITITLMAAFLIPSLVQEGMFVDGVTYSAISKNLANGIGSNWNPHYTKTLYPEFREHPPLVFIIQSLFFRIFGDAFYTERIFCFIVALLTALGIVNIWKLMNDNKEISNDYWLPIFLWLLVPLVAWSYKNNMLENVMGLFTIFAVCFLIKAIKEGYNLYLIAGGIFILFAFLSKGFTGLFPIVVPLIFAFVFKTGKKAILSFILLAVFLLITSLSLLYLFPGIRSNISMYLDQQVIAALSNHREVTTGNRFTIILNMILELIVPLAIVIILFISAKIKSRTNLPFRNKNFLFFLLIALSASVPLIISLKQRKYYLIPSIPFYALAFSSLMHQNISELLGRVPAKVHFWIRRISYSLLTLIFIFSIMKFGKFSRDQEKLQDVYTITGFVPEGTIISTTKELWSDWGLVAYMSRAGYLSLDCDHQHEFFLNTKESSEAPPEGYHLVNIKLAKYQLYKK